MKPTLCNGVAALLLIFAGTMVPAQFAVAQDAVSKMSARQAGYYRQRLGDIEVTALSDGTVLVAKTEMRGIAHKRLDSMLAASFLASPMDTSVNAYVFRLGGRVVLIDAGVGELYGPNLGKLTGSLQAAGYRPDEVTDVFITHVHSDHIGGLSKGSTRVFANAKIHIERKDLAYWLSPANAAGAPVAQRPYFTQATDKLAPYQQSGQIVPFDGAVEFFAGFASVPAPGHTPGHVFYALENHGQKLMFWADILHVPDIQFAEPSATVSFDVDPKEAARQRQLAFIDAARFGYMVAPSHLSFPGFGHVRQDGRAFRFYRVSYVDDAKQ